VTSWTPSPWKASLRHTALKQNGAISPHCLAPKLLALNWRTNRWASYTTCNSLTHSRENNPAQPLGRLNTTPAKLKQTVCNLTLTVEVGVKCWICPRQAGDGAVSQTLSELTQV
jgi:hypothetical protein